MLLPHSEWRLADDGAILAQLKAQPMLKQMIIDAQKNDEELKKKLLFKAHNTVYTMHLGGNKMYQDLKQYYWWKGMKRDVTEYVSKCLTCQQVKAEHQVPTGMLNPLLISQWKWDNISMDFVSGFPLTQQKHDYV